MIKFRDSIPIWAIAISMALHAAVFGAAIMGARDSSAAESAERKIIMIEEVVEAAKPLDDKTATPKKPDVVPKAVTKIREKSKPVLVPKKAEEAPRLPIPKQAENRSQSFAPPPPPTPPPPAPALTATPDKIPDANAEDKIKVASDTGKRDEAGPVSDNGSVNNSGASHSASGEAGGIEGGRAGGSPGGKPGGVLGGVPGGSGSGEAENEWLKKYKKTVYGKINRSKVYPFAARKEHIEGRVVVRFTILESGEITGVSVVTPCEFPILNEDAPNWVRRAAPFPPLPADADKSSITLTYGLRYRLTE